MARELASPPEAGCCPRGFDRPDCSGRPLG